MVLKKNLVCIFVIMLIPNVPIHAQNIPYSANVGDKYYFKVSEFNFTSNVNSFLPLPASYILNTPFEIDVTSKNEGANTSQINYKLIYGNLNVDYSDPFMHVNTSIDNFIQIPLFWLNWQNNSQFAQYDVNSRQNETLTPYLLYISVEILTLFYKPFSLLEPFTQQVSINKSAGLTETILYQEQIAYQTYSLKFERLNEFELVQTYLNV